jgi:glycerol-3-phosphate dehydrogenase
MIGGTLQDVSQRRFDLAVIGGGIHGVCAAMEAARRGRRVVLLEKDDFGGATSLNSYRILHGGLRYLQSADLPRFYQSVRERRWFSRHLPELVAPLACVLPLYGRGLKRRSIFAAALRINDALAGGRNNHVPAAVQLPSSAMLSRAQTLERLPPVETTGLQGAGLWYDAQLCAPQRLIMELLRWASACGATALNRTAAVGLMEAGPRVTGLWVRDETSGQSWPVHATRVINAAGPSATTLAHSVDPKMADGALGYPSLAFNVIVDRPPPFDAAVAAQGPGADGQVYFVRPFGGQLFIGTGHAPWSDADAPPKVDRALIESMLDAVSAALPGLALSAADVTQVMAGLLPATKPGGTTLTDQAAIYDHARRGGPRGLISIAGVKYTTARAVAAKAVQRAIGSAQYQPHSARPPALKAPVSLIAPNAALACSDAALKHTVELLFEHEAATNIEDVLWRRTAWGMASDGGDAVRRRLAAVMSLPPVKSVEGDS